MPIRTAKLSDVAAWVSGEVQGDKETLITGVGTLENAKSGDISFLANKQYQPFLSTTHASAVILDKKSLVGYLGNAIIVDDPYLAYALIAEKLYSEAIIPGGIHSSVQLADDVDIAEHVSLAANVVIGNKVLLEEGVSIAAGCVIADNVQIGANTRLAPNVTVCKDVKIGKRTIIHPGVVIGSDGFGIAKAKGKWQKVPQIGSVIIGDDVEIGANTTIDRGAIGDTIIHNGVKLDNLIQIAHNVEIGEHTAIAACVGIAGSAKIGKHCAIGGGSGIIGHSVMADHVHITAMSFVMRSVDKSGVYSSGTPFMDNQHWHKSAARYKQLDDMAKRIKYLEQKLMEK